MRVAGIQLDSWPSHGDANMNKLFRLSMASLALAATLLFSGSAFAFAPQAAKSTKAASKTTATAAPTAAEIADAKAKGLVWVNTSTKVYHKDGTYYGNTKQGKFMTEADAEKAGFRAAKEPGASKKSTGKK